MISTDHGKTVAARRDDIRQQLINLGLKPREADARATIAQTHLTDFQHGGLPA